MPQNMVRVPGFKSHHCTWYTFLGMHTVEIMVAPRVLGPCQPHGRPGVSFTFLALACSNPGCCSLLQSKPVAGRYLSLSHDAFHVNYKFSTEILKNYLRNECALGRNYKSLETVPWPQFYLPPAKDALICTCQTWGGFHAAMAFNAIKCMFIAASSPSEHWLWQDRNHILKKMI